MPTKSIGTQALEQDTIAIRRQRVSSLRNRGLTHEEIWQQLSSPVVGGKDNPSYLVNPETSKPFDRTTITRDLQWLRADNRKQASANTEEHVARQYAEIQEIKRAAWSQRDPDLALKALEKEMKLLGTMKQPGGVNITVNLEVLMRFEQVARELDQDSTELVRQFTDALLKERANAGHASDSE